MTPPHLHRSSSLLARSAVAALLLAGGASVAVASTQDPAGGATQAAPRVAVLAGSDASAGQVGRIAPMHATVVTTGGDLETQAQAARLAAQGYDTVIAVGAQARAAAAQAQGGEVGTHTRWTSAR